MDAAIRQFVEERQPDALLVSGDLTQRARPEQFQATRRFLDSLSLPKVVVPGNHDVPLWSVHERLFNPLGRWRRWFSPETEPTLKLPGLWVYGINTAKGLTLKNGSFRESSLARMRSFFADSPADTFRMVVAHHHLTPAVRTFYDPVAGRAHAAAKALATSRVDLVVSGHLHHGFLRSLPEHYGGLDYPTRVLHSGTSMSSRGRWEEAERNSMNWIDMDGTSVRISRLQHVSDATFVEQEQHVWPRPIGL